MGQVTIRDIAEELGVSTATVSNVIHGKTKKISEETVRRVQELLEKRQYIPNMAGILLAQNNSKIFGVVIHKHQKYEGGDIGERAARHYVGHCESVQHTHHGERYEAEHPLRVQVLGDHKHSRQADNDTD